MRAAICILITIQLLCFAVGIYLLTQGSMIWGPIIITASSIAITINIDTLRKY
jgi:hypothetical protein